MLHPCTWSFPCWLVKQMSCLWASRVSLRTAVVSHRSAMRARQPRALRQMMHMPCTVSVHMDGHNRRAGPQEAKGFVVSAQVLGAANWRGGVTWITESPNDPPSTSEEKKKKREKSAAVFSPCSSFLFFFFFRPAMSPLVLGSEFGTTLSSSLYSSPVSLSFSLLHA